MKKIAIIALCFALGLGILTACRSSSSAETSVPSTSSSAVSTTAPTTRPTTAPTTATTKPPENGMLEDGKIDGNGDAGKKSNRGNMVP